MSSARTERVIQGTAVMRLLMKFKADVNACDKKIEEKKVRIQLPLSHLKIP